MDSEVRASNVGSAMSVVVGERVTVGDSDAEYVVVSVDHAAGRVELLRLKPGKIESGVPVSSVHKKDQKGPRLVAKDPRD